MSTKKLRTLQKLPASKLKEMCRDASLEVSGTKAEMALRICGKEEKTPLTVKQVNKWLKKQGVDNVKDVSWCLRAGILRGLIDISGDSPLENVVISGGCLICNKKLKATIGDLLYQSDYGGHDYEVGECASVKCLDEDCELVGMYVTGICCGSPRLDSGKEHKHCHICPGFGLCMEGYRSEHCMDCGDHFFSCSGRFKCHCKSSDDEDENIMDVGLYDDSFY